MNIEIKALSTDNTDYLNTITKKLNNKFHQIKKNNPKGYMDSFESRLNLIFSNIVSELGGSSTVNIDKDIYIADFTDC